MSKDTANDINFDGDEESFDLGDFMRHMKWAAKTHGFVVVEYHKCDGCGGGNLIMHGGAAEVLKCYHCGHRYAAAHPRLPLPGEVTKENLSDAIRDVRAVYPKPSEDVRKAIENATPGVRGVMMGFATTEVHRVLDEVERLARHRSGGHR